jgi:hypothetical protein
MRRPIQSKIDSDFVLILAAVAVVYLSLVYAPYRLLDDNWILRGYDPKGSYPSIPFIAVVQGRPLFATMIWLSRELASAIGSEAAIATIRALGILGLSIFAWLLARFVQAQGLPRLESLLIGVGAATLPTFQIYVAGGPWLTFPLVLSAIAVTMLFERQSHRQAAIAVILFGLSFATYQATPFVAIPMVLFAMLFQPTIGGGVLRASAVTAACFIAALVIYYALWRLTHLAALGPGGGEARYSPGNMVGDIAVRVSQFWSLRVPQAFGLWDVRPVAGIFMRLSVAAIVAGLAASALLVYRKSGLATCMADGTARAATFLAAVVASDFAALVSSFLIQSYTTISAMSLVAYLSVCWAIIAISRAFHARAALGLAAFCILGAIAAQVTVVTRLVIPLNAEASRFREAVLTYVGQHGHAPDVIRLHARPQHLDRGAYQEFSWRNLQLAFYAHWFVVNQLKDMGLDDNVELTVIGDPDGELTTFAATRPIPPTEPLVIGPERD